MRCPAIRANVNNSNTQMLAKWVWLHLSAVTDVCYASSGGLYGMANASRYGPVIRVETNKINTY